MSEPRVVAFVNGELGRHALQAVREHLVGVVINEGCDYRYGPLMEKPWETAWFLADDPDLAQKLAELKPTHGVSAGYRAILRKPVIDVFPHGILNVHTSFLPYCRGANPNAWAIFLDQPAGVSFHLVDTGVDTGPIVYQKRVPYDTTDTAQTLQAKLIAVAKDGIAHGVTEWLRGEHMAEIGQFPVNWPTHKKSDLESICIDGDKKYYGWEVINILRARTFPPYPGALYTAPDGKRYRVRIEIEEDHASQDRGGIERIAQRESGEGSSPNIGSKSCWSGFCQVTNLHASNDHHSGRT